MKFEEVMYEFTKWIWYLQTHRKYKIPPKELNKAIGQLISYSGTSHFEKNALMMAMNTIIRLEDEEMTGCSNGCVLALRIDKKAGM